MQKPIRMCIICRQRDLQKNLIRLQCKNKTLIRFTNVGRSFYICKECLNKEDKKLEKMLSNRCKQKIKIIDLESLIYG